MKNQIKLLILFIMFCFSSPQAQVTQQWAARYNGPRNGNEVGSSVAVDDSGNVFVTGSGKNRIIGTGFDYATVKYNSSGDSLWVARYNGPGDSSDFANSLAIDGLGNVYITGSSFGTGTNEDYATIKYNSAGIQQWAARYNGPGNSYDNATSIKVDGSGNVYVTGWSVGIGTNEDYATIKYNSAGEVQWVQRFTGPGNHFDDAYSLEIDGSGNVYVTGGSFTSISKDYITIKYNSSGDSLWVARYDLSGTVSEAYSVKIDSSGNVYITGESGSSYATIKYNSAGIQQWVKRYSGPVGGSSTPTSMAVDITGNVYVTGFSDGSSGSTDYATIKYNSSGLQEWVTRYNGPANQDDVAMSIAVDATGYVYITGFSATGFMGDFATIKYNSSGVQQWLQRYGTASGDEAGLSIALDGSGNVYVSGYSQGIGTGYDYATIKYSQSTGIQNISSEIPDGYSLSQNFPNPFNPTTKINYSLPYDQYTVLKVFDVLGNEVATLVNEKQNAGSYSVDFDGSNFSSGVYFYKIVINSDKKDQTGNFSEVKKMTLIK